MPRVRIVLAAAALGALLGLSLPVWADDGDAPPDDQFTKTGTFRALVTDDFEGAKSSLLYELETDEGEILPLRFASPPEARTGDRVSVTGWPGRRAFEVDEIRPAPRVPSAARP